jgi:glucose/arabinose dehydrogenase
MSAAPSVPSFRRSLMQAAIALLGATALGIAACGGGGGGSGGGDPIEELPPAPQGTATVLQAVLSSPWGFAFLPDGRILVTEKGGGVAVVSSDGNTVQTRLSGPPALDASGQGGLLDVALDPNFGNTRWVYLTFAETSGGNAGTALARGTLNAAFTGWESPPQTIWQQTPKTNPGQHYGARIAFRSDNTLYVATGERGVEANTGVARSDALGVQASTNTIGKVVRLNRDGSPAGGGLGIWSTGHRNPQGAAVRPGTDELWITEHGPRGGDELNLVKSGGNYGWPLRSYGCDYSTATIDRPNCYIGGGTHGPSFVEPKARWNTPASSSSYAPVAPSGLMFYTGTRFPEWNGNLFAGALAGTTLWRIVLDGNGNVSSRQEIAAIKALATRVRDVRQAPNGDIFVLTNGGSPNGDRLIRLAP